MRQTTLLCLSLLLLLGVALAQDPQQKQQKQKAQDADDGILSKPSTAAPASSSSSSSCGCTQCPCDALQTLEVERQKTQLAIVREQLNRAKDALRRQQMEDERKLDDLREEIARAQASATTAQAPNLEALRAQLADQVNSQHQAFAAKLQSLEAREQALVQQEYIKLEEAKLAAQQKVTAAAPNAAQVQKDLAQQKEKAKEIKLQAQKTVAQAQQAELLAKQQEQEQLQLLRQKADDVKEQEKAALAREKEAVREQVAAQKQAIKAEEKRREEALHQQTKEQKKEIQAQTQVLTKEVEQRKQELAKAEADKQKDLALARQKEAADLQQLNKQKQDAVDQIKQQEKALNQQETLKTLLLEGQLRAEAQKASVAADISRQLQVKEKTLAAVTSPVPSVNVPLPVVQTPSLAPIGPAVPQLSIPTPQAQGYPQANSLPQMPSFPQASGVTGAQAGGNLASMFGALFGGAPAQTPTASTPQQRQAVPQTQAQSGVLPTPQLVVPPVPVLSTDPLPVVPPPAPVVPAPGPSTQEVQQLQSSVQQMIANAQQAAAKLEADARAYAENMKQTADEVAAKKQADAEAEAKRAAELAQYAQQKAMEVAQQVVAKAAEEADRQQKAFLTALAAEQKQLAEVREFAKREAQAAVVAVKQTQELAAQQVQQAQQSIQQQTQSQQLLLQRKQEKEKQKKVVLQLQAERERLLKRQHAEEIQVQKGLQQLQAAQQLFQAPGQQQQQQQNQQQQQLLSPATEQQLQQELQQLQKERRVEGQNFRKIEIDLQKQHRQQVAQAVKPQQRLQKLQQVVQQLGKTEQRDQRLIKGQGFQQQQQQQKRGQQTLQQAACCGQQRACCKKGDFSRDLLREKAKMEQIKLQDQIKEEKRQQAALQKVEKLKDNAIIQSAQVQAQAQKQAAVIKDQAVVQAANTVRNIEQKAVDTAKQVVQTAQQEAVKISDKVKQDVQKEVQIVNAVAAQQQAVLVRQQANLTQQVKAAEVNIVKAKQDIVQVKANASVAITQAVQTAQQVPVVRGPPQPVPTVQQTQTTVQTQTQTQKPAQVVQQQANQTQTQKPAQTQTQTQAANQTQSQTQTQTQKPTQTQTQTQTQKPQQQTPTPAPKPKPRGLGKLVVSGFRDVQRKKVCATAGTWSYSSDYALSFWVNLAAESTRTTALLALAGDVSVSLSSYPSTLRIEAPFLRAPVTTHEHLKAGTWYHVAVVVNLNRRELKVYLDGSSLPLGGAGGRIKALSAAATAARTKPRQGDLMCAPDRNAAFARISEVVYYNNGVSSTSIKKAASLQERRHLTSRSKLPRWIPHVRIAAHSFTPTVGRICARSLQPSNVFTYTFWLRVKGVRTGWANILHKGTANSERAPGVWLEPNSTRLMVKSSSAYSMDAGVSHLPALPVNVFTHIAIVQSKDKLEVRYNGHLVVSKKKYALTVPNQGPLYCSDKFHAAADVEVRELNYYRTAMSSASIKEQIRRSVPVVSFVPTVLVRDPTLISNVKAASSAVLKPSSEYTVAFWVNLAAVHRSRSTILSSGKFEVAVPTMKRGLQVSVPMQDKHITTFSVDHGIQLRRWTHVAIVAQKNRASVYVDGRLTVKKTVGHDYPAFSRTEVRLGGSTSAPGMVASAVYIPGAVTAAQLKAMQQDGRKLRQWKGRVTIRSSVPTLVKGAVCANWDQLEPSNEFTLQAFVRVIKHINGTTNIFQKGNVSTFHGPSLFLDGRTVVVRMQTETREVTLRAQHKLPYNRYTLVTVTAKPGQLALWVGNQKTVSPQIGTPMTNRAPLYCSGPTYTPAAVDLRGVTYQPSVSSDISITTLAAAAPKRDARETLLQTGPVRVGPSTRLAPSEVLTLSSSFSFSFFVSFDAYVPGTRFILRRGTFGAALTQGSALSTGLTVYFRTDKGEQAFPLPSPSLKRKVWTHVAVAVGEQSVRVYINGAIAVDKRYEGVLVEPVGSVYCALPQDKSAYAHLVRVSYFDGQISGPQALDVSRKAQELKLPAWPATPIQVREARTPLVKGAQCAGDSKLLSSNDFGYCLWLRFSETSPAVTNVLYKGETYEARMPAIFVHANSTRLSVRQRDDTKENRLDTVSLPLKSWFHVCITAAPEAFRVYINGQQVASSNNITTPLVDHHPLFCSTKSDAYPPAKAEIGQLYYAPYAMTEAQVNALMGLSRPSYVEAPQPQQWTANYTFRGVTTNMNLSSFSLAGGLAAGKGRDALGSYNIIGSQTGATVNMDKKYPTWTVKYVGTLSADGRSISGNWTAGTNAGSFRFDRTDGVRLPPIQVQVQPVQTQPVQLPQPQQPVVQVRVPVQQPAQTQPQVQTQQILIAK